MFTKKCVVSTLCESGFTSPNKMREFVAETARIETRGVTGWCLGSRWFPPSKLLNIHPTTASWPTGVDGFRIDLSLISTCSITPSRMFERETTYWHLSRTSVRLREEVSPLATEDILSQFQKEQPGATMFPVS